MNEGQTKYILQLKEIRKKLGILILEVIYHKNHKKTSKSGSEFQLPEKTS